MGGQVSLTLPRLYSLTPVLWKSDGLPLTQLWLILSDYITHYRSLVGLLKWAHWFLIRTPLNTSWKELGKYILQIRLLLKISEGMFPIVDGDSSSMYWYDPWYIRFSWQLNAYCLVKGRRGGVHEELWCVLTWQTHSPTCHSRQQSLKQNFKL